MPSMYMDVDAALTEVPINICALIDDGDFKTREESVVFNQGGLDLVWNFETTAGVFTQTAVTPTDTGGVYDWVNQGNGLYTIEIPASGGVSINNDTEGTGWFTGFATGILPWCGPSIVFRAAGLNNLLIDTAFSATRGLAGTALPAVAAAASGGLTALLDRNMDITESQRGKHTGQGSVFYCDFDNGNDSSGDGTRALPYKTLQAVHDDLVTAGAHDVVIMLATGSIVTTHTSSTATQLSKRYMCVRGPGRDLIFTRSTNGNTIEITASGIEIFGMQIGTHSAGSGDGINVVGADFTSVHECWILATRGDGIHLQNATNSRVFDNHFDGTGVTGGGQGVHISGVGGSSHNTLIYHNHFANTDGTAILIEQATTNDSEIHHNTIHNSGAGGTGWGIDITSSSTNAQVHDNVFGNNADGDIRDNGTTSILMNNRGWLSPTTVASPPRMLDVTANGNAGIDWGNVENASGSTAVAAILAGTITELSALPGVSPSLTQILSWLYMMTKNGRPTTNGLLQIRKDDGTVLADTDLTDNGTTFGQTKFAAP